MAEGKNITAAQLVEFAKKADERLDTLESAAKLAVQHAAQTLTDTQKSQARTNIGAASSDDVAILAATDALLMPGSLKWDGEVGDKYFITIDGDSTQRYGFIHVSDEVPTFLDATVPITVGMIELGDTGCLMYSLSGTLGYTTSSPVTVYVTVDGQNLVYFVTEDTVDEIFPYPGTYFLSVQSYAGSKWVNLYGVNALSVMGYAFASGGSVALANAEDGEF